MHKGVPFFATFLISWVPSPASLTQDTLGKTYAHNKYMGDILWDSDKIEMGKNGFKNLPGSSNSLWDGGNLDFKKIECEENQNWQVHPSRNRMLSSIKV